MGRKVLTYQEAHECREKQGVGAQGFRERQGEFAKAELIVHEGYHEIICQVVGKRRLIT